MAYNMDLLFSVRPLPDVDIDRYKKGIYYGKYYNSEDKVLVGLDGQNVRFTFNDFCEVIETFPLAKPTDQRYDDYFQKSYGKHIQSSKNILSSFNIKYHNNIKEKPTNVDYSVSLVIYDYNVMYSETSPYLVQNMVLGQELVNVLTEIVDSIRSMNDDISQHVHPNVSTPINWRISQIDKKLKNIREYLPNILSTRNFLN